MMAPKINPDEGDGENNQLSSSDVPSYITPQQGNDSDDEDLEDGLGGYELLPQDAHDLDDFNGDNLVGNYINNEPRAGSSNEVVDVDDNIASRDETITLNSAKIEEIKSCMAGFKLPDNAVPEWASLISDEDLLKAVDAKLKNK